MKIQTAQGTTADLATVSAAGRFDYATSTVTYLHANVAVYTMSESGDGQYCFHAICHHNHPDTEAGKDATRICCDRLSNIINSGKRIPKWATLHNG
jgi:hypothetical protein